MPVSKLEEVLIKVRYAFLAIFIIAGFLIVYQEKAAEKKDLLDHPPAVAPNKVGTYTAYFNYSGGGYFYDEVLEYRVWIHPEKGGEDVNEGSDYYYAFPAYAEALKYSKNNRGTEEPIALVLQKEWVYETDTGRLVEMKEERITEWKAEWLKNNKRTNRSIEDLIKNR